MAETNSNQIQGSSILTFLDLDSSGASSHIYIIIAIIAIMTVAPTTREHI